MKCEYCGRTFAVVFRRRGGSPEPSLTDHLWDCLERRKLRGDQRRADIALRHTAVKA